jgi:hypothetical protein
LRVKVLIVVLSNKQLLAFTFLQYLLRVFPLHERSHINLLVDINIGIVWNLTRHSFILLTVSLGEVRVKVLLGHSQCQVLLLCLLSLSFCCIYFIKWHVIVWDLCHHPLPFSRAILRVLTWSCEVSIGLDYWSLRSILWTEFTHFIYAIGVFIYAIRVFISMTEEIIKWFKVYLSG